VDFAIPMYGNHLGVAYGGGDDGGSHKIILEMLLYIYIYIYIYIFFFETVKRAHTWGKPWGTIDKLFIHIYGTNNLILPIYMYWK
jgi:hypothetical protein